MSDLTEQSQRRSTSKRDKVIGVSIIIALMGIACYFWAGYLRPGYVKGLLALARESPAEREQTKEGIIDFLHGSFWNESEGLWTKHGTLLLMSQARTQVWAGVEIDKETRNEVDVQSYHSTADWPGDPFDCEFQLNNHGLSGSCREGKGHVQLEGRSKDVCFWAVEIDNIQDTQLEGTRILEDHSDIACEEKFGVALQSFTWKLTQYPGFQSLKKK